MADTAAFVTAVFGRDEPGDGVEGHGTVNSTSERVVATASFNGSRPGLAIGLSSGSVCLYETLRNGSYGWIASVQSYGKDELTLLSVVHEESDLLLVGYASGVLALYTLPSGFNVATTHLPFAAHGICVHRFGQLHGTNLSVWGNSCELRILDLGSLSVTAQVSGLVDWPVACAFKESASDESGILIAFRNGEFALWKVGEGLLESKLTPILRDPDDTSRLGTYDNPVLAVSRGPTSSEGVPMWLVLSKLGWSMYRLNHDGHGLPQFLTEFSAGAAEPFTSMFGSDSMYALTSADSSVLLVSEGRTVPLDSPALGPVHFTLNAGSLVGINEREPGAIDVYSMDPASDNPDWSKPTVINLVDAHSSSYPYLSGVHGDAVVIIRGNLLAVYELPSFLDAAQPTSSITTESEFDRFTAIESPGCQSSAWIIAGTQWGRVYYIDKATTKLAYKPIVACSSPVSQLFSVTVGDIGHCAIAISANDDVTILDSSRGEILRVIPSRGVDIRDLVLYASEGLSTVFIGYENDEKRAWSIESGSEIDPMQLQGVSLTLVGSQQGDPPISNNLLVSMFRPRGRDSGLRPTTVPMVAVNVDMLLSQAIAPDESARPAAKLLEAIVKSIMCIPPEGDTGWDSLLTCRSNSCYLGFINVHAGSWNLFSSSGSRISDLDVSCTCLITVLWVAVAELALQSSKVDSSVDDVVGWLLSRSQMSEELLSDLVDFATVSKGHLQATAIKCVTALIRRSKSRQAIVENYKNHLPAISEDVFSHSSSAAMVILSCWAEGGNTSNASDADIILRRIAESLEICLVGSAPPATRDIAILLIGKSWRLWQAYFNPLNILDSIVTILYDAGFTYPGEPVGEESIVIEHASLVALCRHCIEEIANQNLTLLLSALGVQVTDVQRPVASRITAVRLLAILASAEPRIVDATQLASATAAVVKTLDAADSASRSISPASGTSLITEATRFLSAAMSSYTDIVCFHKTQQRLALSTALQHSRQAEGVAMGLVFNLRSGSIMALLGSRGVQLGETDHCQLTRIVFSPNGRYLAGALLDTPIKNAVTIVTWKLDVSFLQMLPALARARTIEDGESSDSSVAGDRVKMSGTPVVEPRKIFHCNDLQTVTDLKWTADKELELSGTISTESVDFRFSLK